MGEQEVSMKIILDMGYETVGYSFSSKSTNFMTYIAYIVQKKIQLPHKNMQNC